MPQAPYRLVDGALGFLHRAGRRGERDLGDEARETGREVLSTISAKPSLIILQRSSTPSRAGEVLQRRHRVRQDLRVIRKHADDAAALVEVVDAGHAAHALADVLAGPGILSTASKNFFGMNGRMRRCAWAVLRIRWAAAAGALRPALGGKSSAGRGTAGAPLSRRSPRAVTRPLCRGRGCVDVGEAPGEALALGVDQGGGAGARDRIDPGATGIRPASTGRMTRASISRHNWRRRASRCRHSP